MAALAWSSHLDMFPYVCINTSVYVLFQLIIFVAVLEFCGNVSGAVMFWVELEVCGRETHQVIENAMGIFYKLK
jgi:hypothetical protein